MKSIAVKSAQNGTLKKNKQNAGKKRANIAQGLHSLFLDELQDIYWAEKALNKALPKMIKNATAAVLVEALTRHLDVSKEHVTRLKEVFYSIGEKAETKKCKAMSGLIREAKEIMKNTKTGMVRDAGIILAVKKMEHYEIATYGTLCSLAKTLGEANAAVLLHEILNQEKAADEVLSEIAESLIDVETVGTNEVETKTIDSLELNRK